MERKIGVRQAKAHLSRLLQSVKEEKVEYVITAHGRPIARIVPVDDDQVSMAERVRRLEERGWLLPRAVPARPLPPPLPLQPKGIAQQWLQEDRGNE